MIPAAQLLDRDAEAVGDGDQRVAVPRAVQGAAQRAGFGGGQRDDQGIDAVQIGVGLELIDERQFRDRDVPGASCTSWKRQ